MLLNAIRSGDLRSALITFLLSLPIILITLTVHELCHGLAALKLGDPTAKNNGRLTLNPLAHLDPIGTLMMVLAGFGWAKPVPVDPRYFKNPKKGMAITALAGPLSNIVMAFIVYMIYSAVNVNVVVTEKNRSFLVIVLTFLYLFYSMNIYLAVFNLLPIPPLDGSRILLAVLPTDEYFQIMKYERVIYVVILVLMFTGVLSIPIRLIANLIVSLFGLIAGIIPFFH